MNFLGAVNRVLRHEGVISGDDDNLVTFSDTQHAATSQLAQIAIQDELTELISAELLPQHAPTQTTVPTATSTRTYSLASDFVRFIMPETSFAADGPDSCDEKGTGGLSGTVSPQAYFAGIGG